MWFYKWLGCRPPTVVSMVDLCVLSLWHLVLKLKLKFVNKRSKIEPNRIKEKPGTGCYYYKTKSLKIRRLYGGLEVQGDTN